MDGDGERYPIGRVVYGTGTECRERCIDTIAKLPPRLAASVRGLTAEQLDTPYREGGWTVRQVVHHVADSHMNAVVRLKLALTEDWPVVKGYEEAGWAELEDARSLGPDVSLKLLAPMHLRWATALRNLGEEGWRRGYVHPVSGRTTLEQMVQLYAWHGAHHTAHIDRLRGRRGW